MGAQTGDTGQALGVIVIWWRLRATFAAVEKQTNITYSECVFVALGIQHAMRMRCVIFSSVAWPAVRCFSHIISQKARFSK